MEQKSAKPLVSGCVFLIVILGELYLLRGSLSGGFSDLPMLVRLELASLAVALIGMFVSMRKKGWGGTVGCVIASVIFAAYAICAMIYFVPLSELFAQGMGEGASAGKALAVAKLFLILIALVAATPAKKSISQEEYADVFVDAMERQKLEWAKAGVQHGKKTVQEAEEKLRDMEKSDILERKADDFENTSQQEPQKCLAEDGKSAQLEKERIMAKKVNDLPPAPRNEKGELEVLRGCCGGQF